MQHFFYYLVNIPHYKSRSGSVDTPVETITSSVTSEEVIQEKEAENDENEDEDEEFQSPAATEPLHTSPHLSFATEVKSQSDGSRNTKPSWNFDLRAACVHIFSFQGLLRIILLEAQDLVAKDNRFGRMVKGKSDPYAVINVGQFLFKSHVVEENLSPVWNEMYEVREGLIVVLNSLFRLNCFVALQMVLRPQSGQEVQVELFDKDVDKDDFLGRWGLFQTFLFNYFLSGVDKLRSEGR